MWDGGGMRRIILIMCIFMLPSSTVQAEWIQVGFTFGDLSYFDYITNQPIGEPSVLYGAEKGGFISIEIKDYVGIDDDGNITTSVFPYIYMPTPAILNMYTNDKEDLGSIAYSIVYDYYNSFELKFEAESSWDGKLDFEDYFTAHTVINNHIYLQPRKGDGTSDYPLYGDMLDQYFKYLILKSIPLNIDYSYARYSQSSEYIEGFRGYGDAYITNIIYDNVLVPEQNTSILLGFSIIALAGIRRLRRN